MTKKQKVALDLANALVNVLRYEFNDSPAVATLSGRQAIVLGTAVMLNHARAGTPGSLNKAGQHIIAQLAHKGLVPRPTAKFAERG